MSNRFVNFNKVGLSGGEQTGILSKLKSFKMTSNMMIILVVSLLFISISVFYYYNYIAPKFKPSYKANREPGDGSQNQGKHAELLLFYVDWCPHCKTAKPVWEELKSQYQNKTINGYTVIFTEVNCTNETAEVEQMMDKYKIEGYPTIKLLKDGQIIEYDAKPSKATLDQFLNTVL